MALSRGAREYLERVKREKEERKKRATDRLAGQQRTKERAEAAKNPPPPPDPEPSPEPEPAPPPPIEPEPPKTMFPVPVWLANPRSPYYSPDLVANPNYQIEFRLPDGSSHWKSNPGPQTYSLLCRFEEVVVGGRRGGGKLSPLDSQVCTPMGFVRMGDIKVGDAITDPTTGGATRVLAIHPHPPMKIWRLTFDDGASLEVGEDHLWAYRVSNKLRPNTKKSSERAVSQELLGTNYGITRWATNRVGPTSHIMGLFNAGGKVRIPLSEPVIFTHRAFKGEDPIDPYLVGLFLGDGALRHMTITTGDKEIAEFLLGLGFTKYASVYAYGAKGALKKKYRQYFYNKKMEGHRAWEKHIPKSLKVGSIASRVAVLQGLLDTDGTVDDRGRVYFCSTSKMLAEDVQFIVRSLGGKARLRVRNTTCHLPNGEKKAGRTSFQLRIWHPKLSCLFRLSRKKDRCTDSWNGGLELSRELVGVEYVGEKEARCITVSSPYGLYVADDFIVTHNSVFLIAKPAMGDMTLPPDDPARASYLNDRSFRGLFLREEYQSLVEFIEEAKEFFKPFGGVAKGDPVYIDFKSGARIYFNHLQDENAFKKYKGWNLTFIGIEELTNIRTAKQYLRLLGSLRSAERVRTVMGPNGPVKKTFPALKTQIVSTTNPDGPGSPWVKDRFVKVPDSKGELIPWGTPMFDSIAKAHRIFIPFPLEANPTYAEDTPAGRRYRSMLMSQDEVTRRQWMFGDWDAGSSVFFTEYRPNGPIGEEEKLRFPWARHICRPVALQPWWHRWGSGDHGFDHPSAFHKFCRNEQDHRVHIYDELQMRHVGAFEQGARLAQWWQPDLVALQKSGQLPCVVIHLGSDAFSKNDEVKTIAERMQAGIKEVLGPYGGILLKYDDDEREAMLKNPKRAQEMFQRRIAQLEGRISIALKPVYIDRKAAYDYMREMVRFRPAIISLQTPQQREQYLRDVLDKEGREEYERQAQKLRSIKPEVLPKLQIWDCCKELDRCMKVAQKDMRNSDDPTKPSKADEVLKFNADSATGLNGDDALDCVVANTLVQTPSGQVPIQNIRSGDLVETRIGPRRVIICGLVHRNAEVRTVGFSNGASLTGTCGHLVWVDGEGFKRLDSLRNGDIITKWQRRSSLGESSSGDTPIQNDDICGSITGRAGIIEREESALSIKKYGVQNAARFLKAFTSTIKTTIRSITASTISTASQWPTISEATERENRKENTCVGYRFSDERQPKVRTLLPNFEGFQPTTFGGQSRRCRLSIAPAISAGGYTSPSTQEPRGFVTSIARRVSLALREEITYLRTAINAALSSYRTSTTRSDTAPVHVLGFREEGRADVYDLSVEEQPEYFANGILVHNSGRNGIVAFKEIEATMPLAYYVAEKMNEAQEQHVEDFGEKLTDNTRLMMIAQTQAARYNAQECKQTSFTLPRASSRRHRVQ